MPSPTEPGAENVDGLWVNTDPFSQPGTDTGSVPHDSTNDHASSHVDHLQHAETASFGSGSGDETLRSDAKSDSESLPGSYDLDIGVNMSRETSAALRTLMSVNSYASHRFHIQDVHASGPSKAFNPTNVRLHMKWDDTVEDSGRTPRQSDITQGLPISRTTTKDVIVSWRSRDSRKGRNSVIQGSMDEHHPVAWMYWLSSTTKRVALGHWKMFSTFPYWDMAFWSGWSYTIGSILFVLDGVFAWGPLAFPSTAFSDEADVVGYMFFFGALFYELGAVVAYLEAVNDGSFAGAAMRRFIEGNEDQQKKLLDEKLAQFFRRLNPCSRKRRTRAEADKLAEAVDPEAGWAARHGDGTLGSIPSSRAVPPQRRGGIDHGGVDESQAAIYFTWQWWPTWERFKTHHIRDIGYLACAIQLFGATLYAESGTVALPGILSGLTVGQANGAYWIPQTVASCCFLTASFLFALETQEKWYKMEISSIGWWIGIWAGVGSMGFLLCAIFGFWPHSSGCLYQSSLSSLWGSCAYLISGWLQWYEAVNKNPIQELLTEPGQLKSFQVHPI